MSPGKFVQLPLSLHLAQKCFRLRNQVFSFSYGMVMYLAWPWLHKWPTIKRYRNLTWDRRKQPLFINFHPWGSLLLNANRTNAPQCLGRLTLLLFLLLDSEAVEDIQPFPKKWQGALNMGDFIKRVDLRQVTESPRCPSFCHQTPWIDWNLDGVGWSRGPRRDLSYSKAQEKRRH